MMPTTCGNLAKFDGCGVRGLLARMVLFGVSKLTKGESGSYSRLYLCAANNQLAYRG